MSPTSPGVRSDWSFPAGWTQTGGGASNSVNGNSGCEWPQPITVTPCNSCGNGTARTLGVTTTTVPAQPSAIAGGATPCIGSSQGYSVTNVAGVAYFGVLAGGMDKDRGRNDEFNNSNSRANRRDHFSYAIQRMWKRYGKNVGGNCKSFTLRI